MFAPGNRGKYILHAAAIAVVIISALTVFNARLLFQTELYEKGDAAANSLSVIRAGHLQEIYGVYSRWDFHHPGPAFFYCCAALEGICYRLLHVVRTPFNAHVLAAIIVPCLFFAAALGVAARWVRSRAFLPLALLLAAWHFTAVNLGSFVTNTWSAYVLPFIFLCLLVTTASVAAGQGEDLPLLVAAGSFLIHLQVAQPLFVLPMFVLAYAGLAWTCDRRRRALAADPAAPASFAPWRTYPRAHWLAAALAAVFVLPLGLDLLKGSGSNFALILEHLHAHRGEGHSWTDSFYYFLRFGVYKAPASGSTIFPEGTNPGGLGHYLADHLKMTLIWGAALFSPIAAALLRRGRFFPLARGEAVVATRAAAAAADARPARWRFLGSLLLVWTASAGLTLVWGHIQDGAMFYYNAWFDYSIYYVLALVAAAAVSDGLESLSVSREWVEKASAALGLLCLLLTAGVCVRHREQVRCGGDAEAASQQNTVWKVLRERPDSPPTKLLVFPHDAWTSAVGLAVSLERLGCRPRVLNEWRIMFGDDLALGKNPSAAFLASSPEPLEVWRLVPAAADPRLAARYPLVNGYALKIGSSEIDPARGAAIVFVTPSRNADAFTLFGWTDPDTPESEYVLTEGKTAGLGFRAVPIPPDAAVEMTYDCFPLVYPHKQESQRLGLNWNGTDFAVFKVSAAAPIRVVIPAALWNARPEVVLRFDLPDALSPLEAGVSTDFRQFAFGSKSITFRTIDAPPPTP